MKLTLCRVFLLSILLSLNTQAKNTQARRAHTIAEKSVAGELVLMFKNQNQEIMNLELLNFEQKYNLKLKRYIPNSNIAIVKTIKRTSYDLNLLMQNLMNSKEISIVEPNYIYRINKITNDPDYKKLWGLNNTGTNDSISTGIAGIDISAEKAWDIETGDSNIVVGIIDSGINYNHDDLKENMWKNIGEMGLDAQGKSKESNGIDDDNNGYIDDLYGYDFANKDNNPLDDNGHGTHCSGTIGAKGNNEIGISGVAWNVKLMALKFITSAGSGTLEGAIEAIKYATKMGAKITNNSWGGGPYSEILEKVIKEASDNNILFVAAAGNDGTDNDVEPMYPASYNLPNIISVAAMSNYGYPATFTNTGRKSVHVVAPGVEIYSTYPTGEGSASGYKKLAGTSMAAPHVVGIAALLFSHEPQLTPEEVRTRLITTSQPLKHLRNTSISRGYVNAFNALSNTQPPPDPTNPENWEKIKEVNISSDHPYKDQIEQSWEVEIPEASEIGLYFSKINTEDTYDYVILSDKNGKVIDELTGQLDDYWTYSIPGNYVKITLKTDSSNGEYGFDLRKITYK